MRHGLMKMAFKVNHPHHKHIAHHHVKHHAMSHNHETNEEGGSIVSKSGLEKRKTRPKLQFKF